MKNGWLASGEIFGVVSAYESPPRGSGKSLIALHLVLQQANFFNYAITFNFDINGTALYEYCLYKRYYNVIRHLKAGNIKCRSITDSSGNTNLSSFINENNRIYVIDEAGIFCNASNSQKVGDKWKSDLALLRHYHIRLWWISQYYSQVNKELRTQSNFIVEACSMLKPSLELGGAAKIFVVSFFVYLNKVYDHIESKAGNLSGFKLFLIRSRASIFKSYSKFSLSDLLLFRVYESFSKNIGDEPKLYNIPIFCNQYQEIGYYNGNFNYEYENFCKSDNFHQNQICKLAKEMFPVDNLKFEYFNKIASLNKIYFGKYNG